MRHARLFKDGVTQPAAAHLHSRCNWISSSRMRQWGCVLSTEDYTVWTNWWSLTTAFTYLIGGFFPRLVFGSVGKAWCLQLVTSTLTLYKITFQGVRHSLTLLITSILICSQERVIVIKKELRHPHPCFMTLIWENTKPNSRIRCLMFLLRLFPFSPSPELHTKCSYAWLTCRCSWNSGNHLCTALLTSLAAWNLVDVSFFLWMEWNALWPESPGEIFHLHPHICIPGSLWKVQPFKHLETLLDWLNFPHCIKVVLKFMSRGGCQPTTAQVHIYRFKIVVFGVRRSLR